MFVLNLSSLSYISIFATMVVIILSSLAYISISAMMFVLKLSSLNYISTCGVVMFLKLSSCHRKLLYSIQQTLRWIFRKWEGVVGTGWRWLRIGTGGGRLWVR